MKTKELQVIVRPRAILVAVIKKKKKAGKGGSCGQKEGACINGLGGGVENQWEGRVRTAPGGYKMKAGSLNVLDKVGLIYKTCFLYFSNSRLPRMHPVFLSISSYFKV